MKKAFSAASAALVVITAATLLLAAGQMEPPGDEEGLLDVGVGVTTVTVGGMRHDGLFEGWRLVRGERWLAVKTRDEGSVVLNPDNIISISVDD